MICPLLLASLFCLILVRDSCLKAIHSALSAMTGVGGSSPKAPITRAREVDPGFMSSSEEVEVTVDVVVAVAMEAGGS